MSEGGLGGSDELPERVTCRVGSDETPSTAAAKAIAQMEGCDPTEIPPLYEAIDPGALDRLFTGVDEQRYVETAFRFRGYEVQVSQNDAGTRVVVESTGT